MTEFILRVCMMAAFLLAFVTGTILGALALGETDALSAAQVALAVATSVVIMGSTGLLERRYIWRRVGGENMKNIERAGGRSGGNVQPISVGLGLGLVGGWFAVTHGTVGVM